MGARIRSTLVSVLISGCMMGGPPPNQAGPPPAAVTILAPSPVWMRPEMLGTPLDAHFQTIQSGGTTIFPGAPITGMQAEDFKHEKVAIEDTTSFDANISAWGGLFGVRAGMGATSNYRFASYRAYDVHFISVVDDRYPHAIPPQDAVWYPARIYWGHSYEVVCSGDAHSFTANVAAKFNIVNGGMSTIDGQNGVSCKLAGRGLMPKGSGATWAATDAEIRAAYDDTGAPIAPVFVEYRLIPGVTPPAPGAIGWLSQYSVEVRFNSIRIDYQTNWLRVNYNAQAFCRLDGQDEAETLKQALNGDEGTSGTLLSTSWAATLMASLGQRLACGLQGNFRGTVKSGAIPTSLMQPEMTIAGPGTFSGSFRGSNADTRYTVNYTVTVRPQ